MPYVKEFFCVTPPNPRKLEASELAKIPRPGRRQRHSLRRCGRSVRSAITAAGKDGAVLCFGSLYMIGAIKDALDTL